MNALVTLALFEIRYHLRQPVTWLYALLLAGQGIWLGLADTTLAINPYSLIAGLGPMVMLVASVLAGQALTKDLEHKTAAYLYTLPLPDTSWFTGKFLGTYLTVLGLTLFFPLGLAGAAYSTQTPILVGELADAFLKIAVQNVLLVVSVGYALTVFTRRMAGAYLAMFALGIYALLTQSYRDMVANNDLLKLLDPFGIGIVTEAVEQAGGHAPDLSDTWLISRLLWLGLTLGLLSRAEARFSFGWFADRPSGKSQRPESVGPPIRLTPALALVLPIPAAGRVPQLRLLAQLTRLTFSELTSQVAFRLTLLALFLATIGYALFYGQPDYLSEPLLPTTARMTALRQPLGLFIGLFLMVWTGELAFRERTTGFWVIYDTLPQPTCLTPLAKLLAMLGVAVLLTLVLFGVGLGLQLVNGKTPIEGSLYAGDMLLDGLFRYAQLVALALFVSVLTGNRFLTHAFSAGLLISLTFAPQLALFGNAIRRGPVWRYSFLPGSDRYSDLTGYGLLTPARLAFSGLWWGVALLLLLLAIQNWPRGVFRPVTERLPAWTTGLNRPYRAGLLLSVGWIFGVGYLIGRNGYASDRFLSANSVVNPAVYRHRTEWIGLTDGRQIPVTVTYYHPYNVALFMKAVQVGVACGELIFGPFPYTTLHLTETPALPILIASKPARVSVPESYGWLADRRGTQEVDYVYYRVNRDVLGQWLPNQLPVADAPGQLFLREGLVEYLTAQAMQQRYGSAWLTRQLTRYAMAYRRGRSRAATEFPILQTNAAYVGRDRAALVLTSIGQVWGDQKLMGCIGAFYRESKQAKQPVRAADFGKYISNALPDSLRYLTDYLRQRIYFDLRMSQVSLLPNAVAVQVIGKKWRENEVDSQQRELPIADYVPIVLRDATGRERYRTLVLPGSGEQAKPIRLPLIDGVTEVVIDPLGAWGDNPADNHKRLVPRRETF